MKHFILLISVVYCCSGLQAQTWDLSLSGGSWLNKDQAREYVLEPYYTFEGLIGMGDTITRTANRATVFAGPSYEKNLQLSVGAGYSKALSGRLGYRMGGELHMGSYERENLFELLSLTPIASSMEPNTTLIGLGLGGTTCDVFTNEIQDLGEIDLTPHYSTLHLGLNAALTYELSESLNIQGELSLRTPLYTSVRQDQLTVTRREENGEGICTWFLVDANNTSGNAFRDAIFGVQARIVYEVFSDISVSMGLYQALNNYFVQSSDILSTAPLSTSIVRNTIRPLELKLGIYWTLGGVIKE